MDSKEKQINYLIDQLRLECSDFIEDSPFESTNLSYIKFFDEGFFSKDKIKTYKELIKEIKIYGNYIENYFFKKPKNRYVDSTKDTIYRLRYNMTPGKDLVYNKIFEDHPLHTDFEPRYLYARTNCLLYLKIFILDFLSRFKYFYKFVNTLPALQMGSNIQYIENIKEDIKETFDLNPEEDDYGKCMKWNGIFKKIDDEMKNLIATTKNNTLTNAKKLEIETKFKELKNMLIKSTNESSSDIGSIGGMLERLKDIKNMAKLYSETMDKKYFFNFNDPDIYNQFFEKYSTAIENILKKYKESVEKYIEKNETELEKMGIHTKEDKNEIIISNDDDFSNDKNKTNLGINKK